MIKRLFILKFLLLLFLAINSCQPGRLSEGVCNHFPPGCFHVTVPGSFDDPTRYILMEINTVTVPGDDSELCDIGGFLTIEDLLTGESGEPGVIMGHIQAQESMGDEHDEFTGSMDIQINGIWEFYHFRYFQRTDTRAIELTSESTRITLPVPLYLTERDDCPEE